MKEIIRVKTDCEVTRAALYDWSCALGYRWGKGALESEELFFFDGGKGRRLVAQTYRKRGYHNYEADEWVREMAESCWRRIKELPAEQGEMCAKRLGHFLARLQRDNWDMDQILSERIDSRGKSRESIEVLEAENDIIRQDHAAAQKRISELEAQLREKDDRNAELVHGECVLLSIYREWVIVEAGVPAGSEIMSEASIKSVFQLAIGSGDIVSGVFFAREEDAERAARLWNLSCKAHKGGQIPVEVIENTLAKVSTEGLRGSRPAEGATLDSTYWEAGNERSDSN